ncbi:MAG: FAD-dependent oxidoreductase [Pseudomonadota bacterium]|nr:FAD-dependent oxidoreductase [Pseudomonadota bacterium]
MTSQPLSIAILGAGLMGRMMAVALTQLNQPSCQVTLFDQDDEQGQSSAAYLAAAMLAPLAESVDATRKVMEMGERSLSLWPKFLQTLATPVFFQQQGTVVLSFEQDQPFLLDFQRRLKRQDFMSVKAIKSEKIAQLEPGLVEQTKQFRYGLYLPSEGQLDNRELLKSLAITIKQRDITWFTKAKVQTNGNQVSFNNQKQTFDWVIDCRGLGAQDSMPSSHQLRGVRGEVARVYAPDVNLTRPVRLMHPRYPIYIAPKKNHHFVIGATQIESEDQRQPTVRSSLELLSSCFSLHKGFAEAEILEIKSGLRPALNDNEPKILVKDQHIKINGLFRHGYLLAPAMVEQCVAVIQSKQPGLSSHKPPVFENLVESIQ